MENIKVSESIVTLIRMRLFDKNKDQNRWNNSSKTRCFCCGRRFLVSDGIIDVIRAINRNKGLSFDQSPCLNLPDEAWEEPKLLSEWNVHYVINH